jgi:hypothetical protein
MHFSGLLTIPTVYLSNKNPRHEVHCARIYLMGALDGGKLGRQGAARGRQRAAVGVAQGGKGGVTGHATFEGGGRQSNYGDGSGGRQLCVTGHWCDMLASSWRQVGVKVKSRRRQLS